MGSAAHRRRDLAGRACALSQVVPSVVVTHGGGELNCETCETQMSEFKGKKDLVVTPGPGGASPSFL